MEFSCHRSKKIEVNGSSVYFFTGVLFLLLLFSSYQLDIFVYPFKNLDTNRVYYLVGELT